MAKPLAGLTVLITRPRRQADALCQRIESLGGRAIRFPTLEIAAVEEPPAALGNLARYDLLIFISANAVEYGSPHINRIPDRTQLAAVGKSTAEALARQWQRPVIQPTAEPYNSEQLLALPEFQNIHGRRILIVRGVGGRELLAEALTQRGAEVEYAEVYRRLCPPHTLAEIEALEEIDLLTTTSNESLQNLYAMAKDKQAWLLSRPLVVVSERGAGLASQLGFQNSPIIAPGAGEQGLVDAILSWWTHRNT